jgi:predicted O-linked N-acetylglucosamine transferase (SPINDLY family)
VLAYRAAPVQASYLGYMGSCAIPGVDYILADRHLMPPELTQHFTEKPIYLNSYQANDRQRVIGTAPTRAECGLPAKAFVFCAFNNNYKFTPDVWATWMRILKRSPNSVLWVLEDNPQAKENLTANAKNQGIAANRLIFAGRVMPEQYLARYHCADLFLDTAPYGAGTTASDALWACLPVLTCPGQTMVSRMAGSLLHAVGLPELVTDSAQAYENLAVQLATQPQKIQDAGLLDRTHLRWFTRTTLIELFVSTGFKVIKGTARFLPQPAPEKIMQAIGTLAEASGANAEQAQQDAKVFQYVLQVTAC